MKKAALIIAAGVLVAVVAAHWYYSDRGRFTTEPDYSALERSVSNNALVSARDPAGVLHFDPAFEYIGGQSFVLYGVADTEQHFFVEKYADGSLRSVFWIQYEAYLPDKPYTYDYDDSPLRVSLGDAEFFTDTAVFHNDPDRKRKRGTDGALTRQFLARAGYSYPDEVVYARLVHLTDASRSKELMIIYMDDLAAYGLTAAQLDDGGDSAHQWPEVERAHLARVQNSVSFVLAATAAN